MYECSWSHNNGLENLDFYALARFLKFGLHLTAPELSLNTWHVHVFHQPCLWQWPYNPKALAWVFQNGDFLYVNPFVDYVKRAKIIHWWLGFWQLDVFVFQSSKFWISERNNMFCLWTLFFFIFTSNMT
jgi:hypothetical protein